MLSRPPPAGGHRKTIRADNRIVMGGRDVFLNKGFYDMDQDDNEQTFEGLRQDVRELFPTIKDVGFTDACGRPDVRSQKGPMNISFF